MKFDEFINVCEEEVPPQAPQPPTQPTLDIQQNSQRPRIKFNTKGRLRPGLSTPPAESVRDTFSEAVRDRLQGYEKKHNGRLNRALGGSPFQDADPESDTYKRSFPRLRRYMEMTPDQKTAIGMYGENVKGYYKILNNRLRNRQDDNDDPETGRLIDYMQEHLTGALNRLDPSEPQGTTRFQNGEESVVPGSFNRAVTGDFAAQLANLQVGDELKDDGFGSYTDKGGPALDMFLSGDKDVANAVIRLAEGSKLRNISPVTEFNEGEHIAMPGSRFRVKSIDPKGHYSRRAGDVPLYVLEMIEDLQDDGKINNSNEDD